MRRKLTTLAAAVAVAFTGLFAPTAQAAPAPTAAVPIAQDQVVIYEHSNYNTEITRRNIAPCTRTGDYWQLRDADSFKISSVLLWVPKGITNCNSMGVQSIGGQWYVKCISQHDWGVSWFGPGYNDYTWMVWVGYNPTCPKWTS